MRVAMSTTCRTTTTTIRTRRRRRRRHRRRGHARASSTSSDDDVSREGRSRGQLEWNAWFESAVFDDDDGPRAIDWRTVDVLTAMPVATSEGVVRAMRRARLSERAFEACARALVDVARRRDAAESTTTTSYGREPRGVNARDPLSGLNAVCMASKFGFADALRYLLDNGGDASTTRARADGDDDGASRALASPLMCAIVGASQALTPSMLSKSSTSATGGAWVDDDVVLARFVDVVRVLLALADDVAVNAPDPHTGWTALTFAARKNIPELVDVILTHSDVDVNAPDETGGKTPLHHAALANAVDCAAALRAAGADPSLRDRDGWTAAMHAAFRHPQNPALLVVIDAS